MLAGLFLYGVGAFVMLYAYRFGRLSTLQPVLSMSYVYGAILSVFVLGEAFNWRMGAGICLIICGVILLGGKKG